ncbi:MAG TPA: hypothetical protein VMV79_03325, partial [Alphaproteobacteria bacterium]|nr:hypothetical protein [Alphaproteobacteria bacterium]
MAVELGNGPRQIQLVKPGGVSQRAWDAACAKIRAEINAGAFSQAGDSPGKLQGEIQAAADKTAIEIQKKMEPGNGLSGSRVALGTAAAGEGTAAATGTSLMMDVMTDQLIDGTLFGAAEINQAFGRAFRTFHSIRMANFAVAAAAVIAPRGGLDSSLQGSVMKDIQGDAKLKREVQDRMGRNDVDGA